MARRPDLVLINKKKRTCHLVDFAVPVDHRVKVKESKKINKYLDLVRKTEKTVEHKVEDRANCNWRPWNGPQSSGK